jgi:hypothetical protein
MSLQVPKTTKHTLTLLDSVYAALKLSAARQGLEPNEVIQNLIIDHVIEAGTLDEATQKRIETGRRLVASAVEVAKQRCREGLFSSSITLDTFHACASDPEWAADYRAYVGDDIYKNGNPMKGGINREIGFRIRAGIGGEVEKNDDGKPVMAKVLGEVIQSYTPMKNFDPAKL